VSITNNLSYAPSGIQSFGKTSVVNTYDMYKFQVKNAPFSKPAGLCNMDQFDPIIVKCEF